MFYPFKVKLLKKKKNLILWLKIAYCGLSPEHQHAPVNALVTAEVISDTQ